MSWLKTWDNGVSTTRLRNLEHEPGGGGEGGWVGGGKAGAQASWNQLSALGDVQGHKSDNNYCASLRRPPQSQGTETQRDMTGHISVLLDLQAAGGEQRNSLKAQLFDMRDKHNAEFTGSLALFLFVLFREGILLSQQISGWSWITLIDRLIWFEWETSLFFPSPHPFNVEMWNQYWERVNYWGETKGGLSWLFPTVFPSWRQESEWQTHAATRAASRQHL